MKTILSLFALTILSSIIGSCTLQKRLYRPGITFTWNKSQPQLETSNTKPPTATRSLPSSGLTQTDIVPSQKEVLLVETNEHLKVLAARDQYDYPTFEGYTFEKNEVREPALFMEPDDSSKTITETPPKKEYLNKALISFIMSIAGFISGFGFLLLPLSIVFGVKSLKILKANPGKYRGRGLAIAGIIISSLLILTFLVAVIGWMFFYSFF